MRNLFSTLDTESERKRHFRRKIHQEGTDKEDLELIRKPNTRILKNKSHTHTQLKVTHQSLIFQRPSAKACVILMQLLCQVSLPLDVVQHGMSKIQTLDLVTTPRKV